MASEPRVAFRWGLRAKLSIAFGVLVLVLLALALGGVVWSSRIEGSIEVILRENFRSVLAAQEMKEALERMDSGVLFSMTGNPEAGRVLVDEYRPRFKAALELELSNLTLPGEESRAREIQTAFRDFELAILDVFDTTRSPASRRESYYGRVLPSFQEIKRLADEILQMNQESMSEASERARVLAKAASQQMFLALLAGAALSVVSVGFLARSILGPLTRLTESARQIEKGDFGRVVDAGSDDEVGELAEAFNSMASQLRLLRRTDRARLALAQRISQLTVDSLPDVVVLLAPTNEVDLANRSARDLLGVVPGNRVSRRHREWLDPIVEEARRYGGVDTRGGYERAVQLFVNGRESFFLPHAVALKDPDLGEVGVTVILVDVTDLRRLDEMKSNLVATVSHELMTPLTSLAMALHILLGQRLGDVSEEQRELLESARDDADRLRQILEGLLDVSRLEEGKDGLEMVEVAVADLIHEAVEPLRSAFEEKGVRLDVEISRDDLFVQADRIRASLLLTNLISNAWKHTERGGRVVVSASKMTDGVQISVADTGAGIAREHHERIFERFFRVPGEVERGAGLGLAIAKEIAEAHGGELRIDSSKHDGSRFLVRLPAG